MTPDFSAIEGGAGAGLEPLRAVFIPAEGLGPDKLPGYVDRMEAEGLAALVIEAKPPTGPLAYLSGTSLASSFDTNGFFDLRSEAQRLKEEGVYLAALVSVCADELMALRNPPLALRDAAGRPYSEDGTYWLDPYSHRTSSYITDILTELADMGFDEIILTNLRHPASAAVAYSEDITTVRDSVVAVSNLALRLTSAVRALEVPAITDEPVEDAAPDPPDAPEGEAPKGVRISALLDADAFRAGTEDPLTGVNPELFAKIFDRFCIYTSAEYYDSDMETAEARFGADASSRFAPFVFNPQDTGSYILR